VVVRIVDKFRGQHKLGFGQQTSLVLLHTAFARSFALELERRAERIDCTNITLKSGVRSAFRQLVGNWPNKEMDTVRASIQTVTVVSVSIRLWILRSFTLTDHR
jgi:hypothetical protein